MPVESPSDRRVETLRYGLAYVVQKGRPSEPETGGSPGPGLERASVFSRNEILETAFSYGLSLIHTDVVQHLEGMGEIVLVSPAVHSLDALETRQLRQHIIHQAEIVQQSQGQRRSVAKQHLVEFLGDSLLREYVHPLAHRGNGFAAFGHDLKALLRSGEPGGKTYRPEHPEGIVAEGHIRVQRSTYHSGGQVPDTSERVHKSPEIIFLKTECHRIYGEVPAFLVILQRAVLHDGLAGIPVVGLLSSPHELQFSTSEAQHSRTEIPEKGDVRMPPGGGMDLPRQCLSESHTAALHHNVDILAGPAQKAVPDITPYHKGPHAAFSGNLPHQGKYRVIQKPAGYSIAHLLFISSYAGTEDRKRRLPSPPSAT